MHTHYCTILWYERIKNQLSAYSLGSKPVGVDCAAIDFSRLKN